jgi:hypothetical protein
MSAEYSPLPEKLLHQNQGKSTDGMKLKAIASNGPQRCLGALQFESACLAT